MKVAILEPIEGDRSLNPSMSDLTWAESRQSAYDKAFRAHEYKRAKENEIALESTGEQVARQSYSFLYNESHAAKLWHVGQRLLPSEVSLATMDLKY